MFFWAGPGPRLLRGSRSVRGEELVCDAGDLDHFGGIVDTHDVGAAQYARCDRGGGRPEALFRRSGIAVARERCSEETFA